MQSKARVSAKARGTEDTEIASRTWLGRAETLAETLEFDRKWAKFRKNAKMQNVPQNAKKFRTFFGQAYCTHLSRELHERFLTS